MKRIATVSGQSAIEYLMTYGWMLLVVAVAGGAIFSVVGDQSIESVNGFTGGDLSVENFGLNSEGKLDMVLRNTAADSVEVKSVELSQGGETFTTGVGEEVGVGGSEVVSALGAVEESGSNAVDVIFTYDKGSLENLTVEGSVTGSLDVAMSGETETSNWAYVDVSEASSEVVDTSGMTDFYIMQYEASTMSNESAVEFDGDSNYTFISAEGHIPWTEFEQGRAISSCRDEGYELPSNRQWQASTLAEIGDDASQPLGNNDRGSAVEDGSSGTLAGYRNTNITLTGSGPESWSNSLGIYDLNGNVMEWVNMTIDQSHPIYLGGDRENVDGWDPSYAGPSSLASSGNSDFGNDQYFASSADNRGVRRGGAFYEGAGAGVFSINMVFAPNIPPTDTGFRCVITS